MIGWIRGWMDGQVGEAVVQTYEATVEFCSRNDASLGNK